MHIIFARLGDEAPVKYACEELFRILRRIDKTADIDIRIYENAEDIPENAVRVGVDGSVEASELDDEIRIEVKDGGVITGANPRAVLIAAYRFLRELGCRFIRPGDDGEIIPEKRLTAELINVSVHEKPSYRHRCICIEGATNTTHVINMLSWIPKVGMNEFYIQFFVPTPFLRRWYERLYDPMRQPEALTAADTYAMKKRMDEEIEKRGLGYNAVGHGFTCEPFGIEFAWRHDPRAVEAAEKIKDYLPMINGERRMDPKGIGFTQLCYSNPKVREIIADAVVEYCKNNRYVTYLAVEMADGYNNHCECEECRKSTPSDLYVILLNEIDEKLTAAGLDTRILFAVYCDVLWAPEKHTFKNPDRFIIEYAPVSRTYSYAFCDSDDIGDAEIKPFVLNKNVLPKSLGENIAHLNNWKEKCGCDSIIFDYHLMWDHYLDPGYMACARVLHRDITTLDKWGFDGYHSCQEMRLAFPTCLPMYAMAAGLWDKNSKFEDICDDYFTAAFGDNGAAVMAYLSKITELFDPVFMRNEKPEAVTTAYDRAESIIELTRSFEASHIEKYKAENASWLYLSYHAEYCRRYAELMKRYAKADTEGMESVFNDFMYWLFENQPILENVLDTTLFYEVCPRWLKRAFSPVIDKTVDF